jgi:multidrug resistance efflux pump
MKTDLHQQEPPETLDYAQDASAPEALTPPSAPPPSTWLRVVVSIALILVILGAAAGVAQILVHTKPIAKQSVVSRLPALVESRVVMAEDIRESFVGYGTARAETTVVVAAEVGGLVVELPENIDDGAHVASGDLIVRIDDRTYRNQLERAESQLADVEAKLVRLDIELENASNLIEIAERELQVNQAEYDRLLDLFEKKNASKKELDFSRLAAERSRRDMQTFANLRELIPAQRAELRAMKSMRETEISLANLDVERATIESPLTGHIDSVMVEQGNLVMPGMQIARIIDTDRIEVPVELPLGVRARTRIGAEAVITTEAAPDLEWKASVVRLAPAADESSRTFIAYLEVDNTKQVVPLVPGSFVTARVAGDFLRDALVIPRGALVEGYVFVADGERAVRKHVSIDTLIGDRAVVSGELNSGDRLILSNLDALHDGAAIRLETSTVENLDDVDTTQGAVP